MKKIAAILLLAVLAGFIGARIGKAQSATLNIVPSAAHTSCPAVASSVTQYCFANDGLWQSLSGGAYQQVLVGTAATGVTSLTVCNAAGASCGSAQTGAVTLNIPTKAISTASSVTTTLQ